MTASNSIFRLFHAQVNEENGVIKVRNCVLIVSGLVEDFARRNTMSSKIFLFFFLLLHRKLADGGRAASDEFTFNGFVGDNLTLDGAAAITSSGLLKLTDNTKQVIGHAFHPAPIHFRSTPNGPIFSFSTTFVCGTVVGDIDNGGNGIAFVVSPTKDFSTATGSQFLGILNPINNGKPANHILAIELDTVYSPEWDVFEENHVGIDINGLKSNKSFLAGYYADDTGLFTNISLISDQAMQVWVDYDGRGMQLSVTLAPVPLAKPRKPLLAAVIDLSAVFSDPMFVGFSASTGSFRTAHCVLGWSFKLNGTAEALDYSQLPPIPRARAKPRSKVLEISLPLASAVVVLIVAGAVVLIVKRRIKYAELLEDWEIEFGPHRFSYKDLFDATKGFKDTELLGAGGFGRVYRGVLPVSRLEVAVKRVSHESRQGMREFIAEVVSLGRLHHRNLVQLLGYCRREAELLLVYDFMPKGSLDKLLFDRSKPALNWATRFRVIRGVAAGLLYLHEQWEQIVVHRDIKASNVLLDNELNGRLGDFGLARLYDHGTDPQTTHVVGTMGYIAPELARTAKATTATDMFAFGIFLLEVACGRKPVDWTADVDRLVLLEWVLDNWQQGKILATADPRLGDDRVVEEVEMVLHLGLLCSHPLPAARPTMRQVVQYLKGDMALPELSATFLCFRAVGLVHSRSKNFDDYIVSYPSLATAVAATTAAASAISRGR